MSATVEKSESLTPVTPNEAAWLAEISPKTVNATIDRGELSLSADRAAPGERRARTLEPADVFYLAIRRELADLFSARAKHEVYRQLREWGWTGIRATRCRAAPQADLELRVRGTKVTIELKTTCQRLTKRWIALENAKQLVVRDPAIRGGEPVICGTRIPVYLVADLVAQGAGLREVLEDYPALNAAKVRSALAYASTHPKRGRPRAAPWK